MSTGKTIGFNYWSETIGFVFTFIFLGYVVICYFFNFNPAYPIDAVIKKQTFIIGMPINNKSNDYSASRTIVKKEINAGSTVYTRLVQFKQQYRALPPKKRAVVNSRCMFSYSGHRWLNNKTIKRGVFYTLENGNKIKCY